MPCSAFWRRVPLLSSFAGLPHNLRVILADVLAGPHELEVREVVVGLVFVAVVDLKSVGDGSVRVLPNHLVKRATIIINL